jgi:hypothetical protein
MDVRGGHQPALAQVLDELFKSEVIVIEKGRKRKLEKGNLISSP